MAARNGQSTPDVDELPGAFPHTPAIEAQQHLKIGDSNNAAIGKPDPNAGSSVVESASASTTTTTTTTTAPHELQRKSSSNSTLAHDISTENQRIEASREAHYDADASSQSSTSSGEAEEELFRALSRRRSSVQTASSERTEAGEDEIERLLSRMFGHTRQQQSEEEKTRHLGVIFKNLTVKGVGLGAALQPTNGDVFLGPFRFLKKLITSGPRGAGFKPPTRVIIDNFNGCIKPGEMLLVLGRPGSGCSTFLKVLGNQRFGFESVEGQVTYGGADAKEMAKKYRSEVLYNPEDDLHYATLKVKETLKFALKTKAPGKASRREGESRSDYIREFLRVVSKLFWIEHTMDTKVGNELVRGVSGGEKKRVSIAEAMITKASVQSWDNSTRGLDASTALEYVQSLRSLTNMANISTSVALYQAGESLYQCFDKVILIHEGHCCYFGPADDAVKYFQGLGFEKPDRWTSSDFITSVTDKHERKIRSGWEDRVPSSGAQFREAFENSSLYRQNLHEIEEFEHETKEMEKSRHSSETKSTKTKNYNLSFHQQVMACTKRQFLVMIGDKQSLLGKWVGLVFQSLIIGSLFYNLPQTSAGVFTRGGVMFFILLFNALLALAELTSAFDSQPILLKHKSFSFYRPSAYAIAQIVADIPLVFIQVTLFNIGVYFMANLQRTASQFFISVIILWTITMTMYAFFRAVGALSSSLDVATRITGVAIQALVVYTGYLIPPSKMHPWFSWLRWVNPVQYGFEALMANEFYNLEIQCEPPYLVPQVPNASPEYQGCTLQGSKPGSTIVRGSDYIQVAFQYSRSHLWRNVGFICGFFLFFVFLTALGMELQKPNKGGGAITVYKRGETPSSVEKAIEGKRRADDEESGNVVDPEKQDATSDSSTKDVKKALANNSVFTWQNVTYRIPYENGERMLLQDVQGYVKPGTLTALMGASGAGKTTLLNTLAQRIRFGVVHGDFLIDGRRPTKSFQRSTGFAEQMDIHEPTQTVREALRFSARLRQPREVPIEEKYDYCEKILDLLEMRHLAGAVIGKVGAGLNQEQRKRLTIGVELASKPELLLFLDEPTSGLDSGAAFNIVRFLRKLAEAGQSILCTIHQPSSVLFEHFDQLLLLKSGGRTAYFGPLGKDSRSLIEYFQRNGARRCKSSENPAEYMLEAIGAGDPNYHGQDWGDVWEKSPERDRLTDMVQKLIAERREKSGEKQEMDEREFSMPVMSQISATVYRNFVAFWRSTEYMTGMFMLHIFTGLFNAFTFWNLGNSQIDMQSRLFSVFMTLTICPPLVQQLQPKYLEGRNLFQSREGDSKVYSWVAFCWAAILPELPYRILAGTVYWACWYWPTGFPKDTYTSASTWLMTITFEIYYVGFGQAIASFSPNELLASLLVPIFFTFIVAFCGVIVPAAVLPSFWKSWMYWLTPFNYLLEAMLALVTDGVPVRCEESEMAKFPAPPNETCQSYVESFIRQSGGYVETLSDGICGYCQFADGNEFSRGFNVSKGHIWRDYGIFWVYVIFNFAMVFLCTWLYLIGGRKIKTFFSPSSKKVRGDEDGGTTTTV